MSKNQFDQSPLLIVKGNSSSFDFRQIAGKFLYHWPIFLVGFSLAFVGALIYLYFSVPTYEIKASILIPDEKKTSDERSALQEIEISQAPKLVENEIEVLKSRNIILEVVNDLQLWANYQQTSGLKTQDLYTNTPIYLQLLKTNGSLKDQKLEIIIKDNNLYYFIDNKGKVHEHKFSEKYESNFGTWMLEPNYDLNILSGEKFIIALNDPELVANSYQNKIKVGLINKTAPVVGLTINDEVEQRGKDILNELIDNYNRVNITEKSKLQQSTLDFIDQRLVSISSELSTTEGQVEGFRSSRGLTDISSQSQVYLQNIQANDVKLNEVNVQLNIIDGIESYLNANENLGNIPSIMGISDPGLSDLIQKLAQLQLQKEELLATTPEDNPIFNPLNRQINATREAIKGSLGNIKSAINSTKRELEGFNSRFETSIRNLPGQERQLVDIKRQQSTKENLYLYLLQKREELSFSYAATLADARVIDSAYAEPVKETKKSIVLAIAFILGFGFPAGFVIAKETFHNRVTQRREIEEVISAPIIMEIFHEKLNHPLVALERNGSGVGEQFRSLRTQLHFLHGKKNKGRITLLTSSIAEEGKSFVASNLAVALAASGRKTVILELDLRRPKILKIFDLPSNHAGLSNYLQNTAVLNEILQPSGVNPNLDVIGSGPIPSNPSELLEKQKIEELVSSLKMIYDDIILDTPPVQLVTDALILSRLTDVTLYIIRQGHTSKALFPYMENIFQKQQLPNVNIIFNGITAGKYGYGEDYGKAYYGGIDLKKSYYSKSI